MEKRYNNIMDIREYILKMHGQGNASTIDIEGRYPHCLEVRRLHDPELVMVARPHLGPEGDLICYAGSLIGDEKDIIRLESILIKELEDKLKRGN